MAKETEKPLAETTPPVNAPETDVKEVQNLQHEAKSGEAADKDLEKGIKAQEEKIAKELEAISKSGVQVVPSDRDANRAPEVDTKSPSLEVEGPRTEEYVPGEGTGELTEAQIKERDEALAVARRLPNHDNRDFKGTF